MRANIFTYQSSTGLSLTEMSEKYRLLFYVKKVIKVKNVTFPCRCCSFVDSQRKFQSIRAAKICSQKPQKNRQSAKIKVRRKDFMLHGMCFQFLLSPPILDLFGKKLSIKAVFGAGNSGLAQVTSGVPQDSILGPILSSLCTNNRPDTTYVIENAAIEKYADDATLWYMV